MMKVLVDMGLMPSPRDDVTAAHAAVQPVTGGDVSQVASASVTEDLTAPIFYTKTTGADVWPRWLSFGRRSGD